MKSVDGWEHKFAIGRSNRYTIDQMRSYLHRLFLAGSRTLKSGKGLRVISATTWLCSCAEKGSPMPSERVRPAVLTILIASLLLLANAVPASAADPKPPPCKTAAEFDP